ncbi:MAG TPA: hypothetical protein VG897_10140 [Terriglobales bacterium]|nr:hypothetical protein [Terriglobales bacterium]
MTPKSISPDIPTSLLEERAIEQRRRMHNTMSGLREQVRGTVREKLDIHRYAREYALPAAGAAALISLIFGYGTAGVFKRIIR